jgi:hypothetical protein
MIADTAQVIEAIRRLYFDRKLGASLGANGRAFVQDYSPDMVASKWHEIFQLLAAKPEGQALKAMSSDEKRI